MANANGGHTGESINKNIEKEKKEKTDFFGTYVTSNVIAELCNQSEKMSNVFYYYVLIKIIRFLIARSEPSIKKERQPKSK